MPAVIFDRLPEDHVVQMFVTINAKHTRLNASHLVSLSGRQLYRDENLAAAHDVVRALSEREESPLHGEIKLLGVGRGRVAQAPAGAGAQEAVRDRGVRRRPAQGDEFREEATRFFVNYFRRSPSSLAPPGTAGSTASRAPPALRAFIRVAPDIVRHLDQQHADRADFRAIGRVIAPWGRRIGDLRFETDGAWKRSGIDGRSTRQGTAARTAVSGRRDGPMNRALAGSRVAVVRRDLFRSNHERQCLSHKLRADRVSSDPALDAAPCERAARRLLLRIACVTA